MLLSYVTQNFITLMILLALAVFIFINRKEDRIPGTNQFLLALLLLLILTVTDTFETWCTDSEARRMLGISRTAAPRIRMYLAAVGYILRPLIIMIEVLVTAPNRAFRLFCAVPAVINTGVYTTAFFGSHAAFWIDEMNYWHPGPLARCCYLVLFFYIFLLALFTIIYYRRDNWKRSAIIFLIILQALFSGFLEYQDVLRGTADPVTALCILEYYFYLASNHRREMRQLIAEKELHIAQQRMNLLQNQIRPHFIFNSLSIIRSLAKHDSVRAVDVIDSFSDYLKAHVYALKEEDELIPFEEELYNTRAYLDLVQADSRRNITVEYDLAFTDFRIPPLTLEPIVENAIKHGVGKEGGLVRISSALEKDSIVLRVTDNGTAQGAMTDQEVKRLGVGMDNTRSRLKMLCKGTLELVITENGATATIRIPNN